MHRSIIRTILLSSICGLLLSFHLNAVAQTKIELGSSGPEIRRSLVANGYNEVKIIKQSLGATTVEGCLGTVRYRLKILFTGQVKWREEVGKCRGKIDIDRARAILVEQGYSRIDIESRRNSFVAIACQNRERLRLSVDRFGDVRRERRLGRCRRSALSPTDIKADLVRQGYTRIRFIDRQLPRYIAEACQGLTRVELVISSDGDVRKESEIGRCKRAIDPRNLVKIMQQAGFSRVRVIDDRLPQYVVEACRKGKKLEVTLNRFGRISDQYKIGKCRPLYDRVKLLVLLNRRKLTRAKVISQNNGIFIVDLCNGPIRKHVTYNSYGDALGEKPKGTCRPHSVLEVYRAFSNQKYRGLKLYAEGCHKGKKTRVELSSLGDSLGSTILGRCK